MLNASSLTASLLLLATLSHLSAARAQTVSAPAPVTAPSAPAAAPAPAKTPLRLSVPAPVTSALGIEISSAVKGRLVGCPKTLKISADALCLYAPSNAATLRPLIRSKLGSRASDWNVSGAASSLVASDTTAGRTLVLLAQLSDKDSLIIVDRPAVGAPTAARPLPAGVIKGQPYLLGSDLAGVVKVTALGGGQYRLERGAQALTLTAGKSSATLGSGSVQLPQAPASDGTNLLLPFSALGALGCSVTPNGKVLTVACGEGSVGIKPIVF